MLFARSVLCHQWFALVLVALLLGGCSITEEVEPVPVDASIDKVYVEHNPDVHMDEMNDTLVSLIESVGIDSELYRGDLPEEADHYLTYTATWRWDLAVYLSYFDATLHSLDEGRIGTMKYDARWGQYRMDKFGPTRDKVEPLIRDMLRPVAD